MKPNQPNHLRYERDLRGWSQAKVAEEVGTDARSVGRWERGDTFPGPHFREKLCELFGKNAQELGLVEDHGLDQNDTIGGVWPPAWIDDPVIPPLPNEGEGLVGREHLLALLVEQLGAGKCLVLTGLPGVGKTALAVTLIHHPRVRDTFCDGVLWAGLGPRPNVLAQLSRWATQLGLSVAEEAVAENSLRARALALRAALGPRRMVLVVDDAWELESALPFQVDAPNCALLVTTRQPRIAREMTRTGHHTVPELTEEDGLTLLSQLAPAVVAYDRDAAQRLVQEVGCLPLALTIVGKYLHTQAYSGQPRRIQAAIDRLYDGTQRLLLSRPRSPLEPSPGLATDTPLSLQSVIAMSDMQLNEQARAVFRALSVFPAKPNSFSEEAALMVAQADEETLDVLCDANLLESSGPGRYTLHRTIADYASVHLSETLPAERLIAYCTAFIESHVADYELLDQEYRNLLAGLDSAFENNQYILFVRSVNTFAPFLIARGLYDEAYRHLQQAHQVAIWSYDLLAQALLHLNLGRVMYQQGKYHQAEVYFREGLTLARDGEYPEQICQLLLFLGLVALHQKDRDKAETYAQEALLLARQREDAQQIDAALTIIARIAAWRDEQD